MKTRSSLTDTNNKKVVRISSKNKSTLASSPNQKENMVANILKSKSRPCIEGKNTKQPVDPKMKNRFYPNMQKS